jgi:hypothetical protein
MERPFLTYLYDTDEKILLSLSLNDLKRTCQSNKYSSNLCKNSKLLNYRFKTYNIKIDNLLNYINIRPFDFTTQRNYGVILQFNNINQTYKKIRELMDQYNFIDSYKEELEELGELEDYDETIFDKFLIIELSIYILNNKYYFSYTLGKYYNENDNNSDYSLFTTINEADVRNFLLHLYYDNLLVSF